VLPSTPDCAPPRDLDPAAMDVLRGRTLRLTFLASAAGLPALGAPLLARGPLPAGLCLVGAPDSEEALLDLAGP
jgi:Asp-tRNA(Asn)/Glu-tRNA(Gln) amidotransferase A subunit family amidase